MGYIKEPKNVDLVVGPSILTEDTKKNIAQAIARYHQTGKKPASVDVMTPVVNPPRSAKSNTGQPKQRQRSNAKI